MYKQLKLYRVPCNPDLWLLDYVQLVFFPLTQVESCLVFVLAIVHRCRVRVGLLERKNQWGTGWGEDGYIRLPIEDYPGKCGMLVYAMYPEEVYNPFLKVGKSNKRKHG